MKPSADIYIKQLGISIERDERYCTSRILQIDRKSDMTWMGSSNDQERTKSSIKDQIQNQRINCSHTPFILTSALLCVTLGQFEGHLSMCGFEKRSIGMAAYGWARERASELCSLCILHATDAISATFSHDGIYSLGISSAFLAAQQPLGHLVLRLIIDGLLCYAYCTCRIRGRLDAFPDTSLDKVAVRCAKGWWRKGGAKEGEEGGKVFWLLYQISSCQFFLLSGFLQSKQRNCTNF